MSFSVNAAIEKIHAFTQQEIWRGDEADICETVDDMSQMMDFVNNDVPADRLNEVIGGMPFSDRRELLADLRATRTFASPKSALVACTVGRLHEKSRSYKSQGVASQFNRFDALLAANMGHFELAMLISADLPDAPPSRPSKHHHADQESRRVLQMTNAKGIGQAIGRLGDADKREQFKAALGHTELPAPIIKILRRLVDRVAADTAKARERPLSPM